MSDNTPTPTPGATPSKPTEAAKVQPKKETVRINLPPKPTASPTIKIPAPSAVAGATPGGAAPVAGTAPFSGVSPTAPLAPSGAAPPMPTPVQGPTQRGAPSAVPRRSALRPATGPSGVSGIDIGLACAAAVIAVSVVVRVFFLSQ